MESHEEEYKEKSSKNLKASSVKREERDGLLLEWFKIDGQLGEQIPTLLVHKLTGLSGKLVIFLHGLGGCKEDALYLREVAELFGFSILAVDARRHGERKSDIAGISPTEILSGLSGTIVDNRLPIDIALQNKWAEQGKIILPGGSMGGILGGVTAGVDKRISGAVLYVPGGDLPEILAKSKYSLVVQVRQGIPGFVFKVFRSQLAAVDPINYVDKISPRPLLIQLGMHDDIVPFECGMKLFDKANEPKQLVVHDSGHDLPREKAAYETIQWMKRNFPSLTA